MRFLATAVVSLVLAAGTLPPLTPATQSKTTTQVPTFRAAAHYVEVDALVVDGRGEFVADLRPGEFEIREDGRSQSVSSLAVIDLRAETSVPERQAATLTNEPEPGALATSRPDSGVDVVTNEGLPEGALYVLVLDDLHTTMSRTARVKQVASRFIERCVGRRDAAAVLSTGMEGRVAQDFSSSAVVLRTAVDRFRGQKPPSPTVAVLGSLGCFDL